MNLYLKILQLVKFISLWGIDKDADIFEKNFTVLINQYLTLLFALFFCHSISIIIFLGVTKNSIFLGCISISWMLAMLLKEFRKNKYLLSFIFIFLSLVTTYYASYCGLESGSFVFYFSLILGLAFFFDIKKNKILVCCIGIFILSCFYLSIIYDFQLVPKSPLIDKRYEKVLMILNVTFCILTFVLDYYFILKKNKLLSSYEVSLKNKHILIEYLQLKNEKLLKSQIISNNLTNENFNEIIELAQQNDSFFIDKFKFFFPDFFPKLKKINSKLILSDLHLCAMMRLNFDTKQIALYTNTTVKSVESKKYRLRKKLNIPSDVEITYWILSFE